MNPNIFISQESLDEFFLNLKKQKIIVARPDIINVTENNGTYKISLTINPESYQKYSNYTSYKPLFKFVKEEIQKQTGLKKVSLCWEIIRF